MVNLSSLQSKIEKKVFDNLGSTLSVYNVSGSTDKWGDKTKTYTLSETLTSVPWNLISDRKGIFPFGELGEGQVDIAFKRTANVLRGQRVVFNNTNFEIVEVEDFPLANGFLVKVCRLTKEL